MSFRTPPYLLALINALAINGRGIATIAGVVVEFSKVALGVAFCYWFAARIIKETFYFHGYLLR